MSSTKALKTTKICKSSPKIKGCDDDIQQPSDNFYPGKAQCKECLKRHISKNKKEQMLEFKALKEKEKSRFELTTENLTEHTILSQDEEIERISQENENYKIRIADLIEQLDEKEKVILKLKTLNGNLQDRVAELEETSEFLNDS
jgi:hypothetical protein